MFRAIKIGSWIDENTVA